MQYSQALVQAPGSPNSQQTWGEENDMIWDKCQIDCTKKQRKFKILGFTQSPSTRVEYYSSRKALNYLQKVICKIILLPPEYNKKMLLNIQHKEIPWDSHMWCGGLKID